MEEIIPAIAEPAQINNTVGNPKTIDNITLYIVTGIVGVVIFSYAIILQGIIRKKYE